MTQLPLLYSPSSHLPRPRRKVCDLPVSERPLYRLEQHGTAALSNTELLSLALGGREALGLAEELLQKFGSLPHLARASETQLQTITGIGPAQAARLKALFDLSRRLQLPEEERPKVTSPAEAAQHFIPRMAHLMQEELHVMVLDTRSRILVIEGVYKGNVNTSVIRAAELFRPAIQANAPAILIAHNHPSGDCSPSPEDITTTKQLVQAGKLLDIELLDHLVIGTGGRFVSLKERGIGFD